MAPKNVETVFPLSPMQQGMLFHCQSEPGAGLYVEQIRLGLSGLDAAAFRRAWQSVADHSPSLRTSIVGARLAEPAQVVRRKVELPWEERDWRALSDEERQQEMEAFLQLDGQRGFQLDEPSLSRVTLMRTGESDYECVWTLHHIALDGWSGSLILKDVLNTYGRVVRDEAPSLPDRLPFRDYILWLRKQDLSRAEAHWRKTLSGFAEPTPLGLDGGFASPGGSVAAYSQREARLSKDATDSLRAGAARCRVTPSTLLQGAWALWLGKYGGVRDVVFGTVVSGRPEELEGVDEMVGMFVNTLPTRVRIPSERTAREWLQDLQREEAEQRQYPYSPLWRVQQWSEVPPGTPLFQSLFVFENYRVGGLIDGVDGLEVRVTPPFDRTGYPLLLLALPGEELVVRVTYDRDRFDAEAVERLLVQIQGLARRLADHPERPLSRFLSPDDAERALVVSKWNQTDASYPTGRCLQHLFEEQVDRTPGGAAVLCGAEELSYRELDERSNRLARCLQESSVGPEARVGLCLERSQDMVVAILGVLKAGGAYVPLDPTNPQDRLATIAEDAELVAVIAHAATRDRLDFTRGEGAPPVLCLDADRARVDAQSADRLSSTVAPENLAYVLYTSGSTGRPKGVAMPHAPLVNLMHWQLGESGCGEGDRTLQFAPFSFDVSCQEVFATLASGGTLCLVDEELRRDPEALLDDLRERSIHRIFLPFVALQQLAEAAIARDAAPGSLREVITAGEQLQVSAALVELFQRLPSCALVNQYGPTECHVVSSLTLSGAPETWPALPSIGKPIANTRLFVLDEGLQPVPVGVPGELFIGGAAVSRGYLGDEELTNRSYLPDPFHVESLDRDSGDRMYRTGDLARWCADGEIEFLGRADSQVKLRGFRVELGEIEAALLADPRVRAAAAVVREDRPGDRRLVAYIVADGAEPPPASELRAALEDRLPDYMLPAAYVALDRLPTTTSGKVDRRALLAEEHAPLELRTSYVAPRGPEEEALAELFADVLGVPAPGVHDDFFDLGGHSLLATRLVSRARDVLQVELPLRCLFEHPTIAELATVIRARRGGVARVEPLVASPDEGDAPLSFAQQRLWFLDQMEAGAAYNMPWAFELVGALDVDALERSLLEIVRRHDALRTRFPAVNGKPVQRVVPTGELGLSVGRVDLSDLAPAEREKRAAALALEEAERPFDLATGPVFRPSVVRLADDRHLLFLSVHHIAFDGWSIHVLNRELQLLYSAFARGEESPLPELGIQYADFTRWQTAWLQGDLLEEQLGYWCEHLTDLSNLRLPTDRPRPKVQTYRGAAVPLEMSADLVRSLQVLSRREGVTLAMTLIAGFQALLARCGGQDDIVLGSPIANRTRSEVEDLIGFFVNSIVLRGDLSGDPSFREILDRVQQASLSAYEHQDLPFERLVDELQPERDQSRNPVFQVVFAMQNTPHEPLRLPGLEIRPWGAETQRTRFDLELHLSPTPAGLSGGFVYNCDLFDAATIECMVERFRLLLEGVVADPGSPLSRLPVLLDEERRVLLTEWNDSSAAFPVQDCLHELFEAQVQRTPDAVAITCEDRKLTYRELNARANQLAHHLRAKGVGPETLVGLCVERDLGLVVSILGILKAGGGYVPLDLANPVERIAFILDDTRLTHLVTESEQLEKLPDHPAERICIDRDSAAIDAQPDDDPRAGARPENVAYVIYTSGSTGKPKGVLVEHGTVARLFPATEDWFHFDERDVWTLFHSCAFDFSVWEMWGALLHGGRLVVVPYWVGRSPEEFHDLLAREGVTVLNQTPSAFRQLVAVDEARGGAPELALRYVVFGGEALELSSLRPWFERHGDERPQLVNMYGITETTVHVTYRALRMRDLEEAPGSVIGRPIPDLQVYVLDEHLVPAPIGSPGEMYVGGAGVARGYLDRPELTDARFVPDPFRPAPGARLYRTGDVARYLSNRDLEYLGRNDEQVKVRGFRIELGEIEAALNAHPRVRESVVTSRGEGDDKRLVAYLVPDQEGASSEEAEVVGEWSELYDDTYSQRPEEADPTFNIIGWNSSYTGQPIPAEEMHEWVDQTVARILRGRPQRVLELGCGTGLLLFRVAPSCAEYVGADFSRVALQHIEKNLPPELKDRVTLTQRSADHLEGLPTEHFDAIVINSVIQYFPSITYFLRVVEAAVAAAAPGGRVVLGDLRNYRLLEALHASVENHRAEGDPTAEELHGRVKQHVAQEEELLIDPSFFLALPRRLSRISHVEVELKRGSALNELTKYRYEVTLHVEGAQSSKDEVTWLDWTEDDMSLLELRRLLASEEPALLGVRGIPNERTLLDCALAAALERSEPTQSLEALRAEVRGETRGRGVDPSELLALGEASQHRVSLSWASDYEGGAFDALFWRGDELDASPFPAPSADPLPWPAYANHPMQARMTRQLAPLLRESLSQKLPGYMVPSAFVMLDSVPLTANGKVNRSALPEPEWYLNQRAGAFEAPESETEQGIAAIWSELLGVEQVGSEDDFFDLGGHSLLATQVVSRLRETFEVELPLRQLFEAPTLKQLAELVDGLRWIRDERPEGVEAATSDRESGEL